MRSIDIGIGSLQILALCELHRVLDLVVLTLALECELIDGTQITLCITNSSKSITDGHTFLKDGISLVGRSLVDHIEITVSLSLPYKVCTTDRSNQRRRRCATISILGVVAALQTTSDSIVVGCGFYILRLVGVISTNGQ